MGSSANSSLSYSASTGAAVSFSRSVTATFAGAGWFHILLLVTGGFGRVVFFGPTAVVDDEGLGLATFAGLPTCTFHGTFAGGGVTTGGTTGVDAACVGGVARVPPPTCTCGTLVWVFSCCLAFFNFAFAISCFLSDHISLLKELIQQRSTDRGFCFKNMV